jgi:hypothetical protein
MTPFVKHLAFLLMIAIVAGCAPTRRIHDPTSNVTVIDYSAGRRGAYIFKGADDKTVIVSEPSPDIAKSITTSLGLSAETIGDIASPELKVAYAGKVIDLANRSQTLQVLREALFRLSEMGASYDLTKKQRVALYNKVLDTVKVIAATEFANSKAPAESKKALLKEILSDVGTGTVEVPGQ